MGARLSTTSEGLWLTAALAGVTRLPAALRVRPVGEVEAMLAGHPGLEILQTAGICEGRTLDGDVADWLLTLGRCDVEISVWVSRADERAAKLTGPPPLFETPEDPLEDPLAAAEALRVWRAARPADRSAVVCRRDGRWVAAARMWRSGDDPIDEVVISPLDPHTSVGDAVNDILGAEVAADFAGINIDATRLEQIVADWQRDPTSTDVTGALLREGLTHSQARIIEAVSDVGATRAAISAVQYALDGPTFGQSGAMVADTLLGRVVISTCRTEDDRRWTMVFPGTRARIVQAVRDVLEDLPSGDQWESHQRIQHFNTR